MSDKLEPCPFCGAKAENICEGKRQPEWSVFCTACDAKTAWRGCEHDAVELWNRRAPLAQRDEKVRAEAKADTERLDWLLSKLKLVACGCTGTQENNRRDWTQWKTARLKVRDPGNSLDRRAIDVAMSAALRKSEPVTDKETQ